MTHNDNPTTPKPAWVCSPCGEKYGYRKCGIATFHPDTCGVCGQQAIVTEPRDWGYLKPEWEKHNDHQR